MSSQEHRESLALEEAQQLFAQAGIPLPFIPAEMQKTFTKIEDWVYGTRSKIPWLYEIRQYVQEVSTTPVDDYLLLGHAGHGTQSWAMHYYLVRGPLALFLQIAWGGAYTDEDKAVQEMSARFTQAEELIQAVKVACSNGNFKPDERLIIKASDFYGSSWCRNIGIPDKEGFQAGILHESDDVLKEVLSEIQGSI